MFRKELEDRIAYSQKAFEHATRQKPVLYLHVIASPSYSTRLTYRMARRGFAVSGPGMKLKDKEDCVVSVEPVQYC